MTLTALEICMVAIQLALCMQLGTLCIQLSHLYSDPKLLENEWEKNSRTGGQKKEGKKRNASRGKKERKKRKRVIGKQHLLGLNPCQDLKSKRGKQKKRGGKRKKEEGKKKQKKSSPLNQTWVPLVNRHNDRSCANLG